MAKSTTLLPLFLILTIFITSSSSAHATTTTTTAIITAPTPTTSLNHFQPMNSSSSCLPLVFRMTLCLDFLITGSLEPKPSDSCCLRLRWISALDFPCLCDLFFGDKSWWPGGRKLNHTRAESLPLSCGLRIPNLADNNDDDRRLSFIKFCHRSKGSQVFDLPRLAENSTNDQEDHDHHNHAEVPKPSATATLNKSSNARGLVEDNIVPKIVFPVIFAVVLSQLV